MALMNLSSGQEWRTRHREKSVDTGRDGEVETNCKILELQLQHQSVLAVSIQVLSPLRLTGLILLSK